MKVKPELHGAVVPGSPAPFVSVVDDDVSVRESLPALLSTLGFAADGFATAEEFLAAEPAVDQTRCLLLDIALPGMSGPELFQELGLRDRKIPVIFITAQQDETIRPLMLELGAVACLVKPISLAELEAALEAALLAS